MECLYGIMQKKGRYGKTIDRNIKGKEGVTGHEKTSLETDEKRYLLTSLRCG